MRILFAGNKERGLRCFEALLEGPYPVVGIFSPPMADCSKSQCQLIEVAKNRQIPRLFTHDPSAKDFLTAVRDLQPDLIVLAGYGKIIKRDLFEIPPHGCINLHAGKLPEYRGSSPMNWALINGEKEFGLSILQVESGIDSGPLLAEKRIPIQITDHFPDLETKANDHFPEMLMEVIGKVERGTIQGIPQNEGSARYFPLRFPEDGLILWDLMSALEIHNTIRALAPPAPGAYSFFEKRKVTLARSELSRSDYRGHPGRIYMKKSDRILVAAKDRCLWILSAFTEPGALNFLQSVERYQSFRTLRNFMGQNWESQG